MIKLILGAVAFVMWCCCKAAGDADERIGYK